MRRGRWGNGARRVNRGPVRFRIRVMSRYEQPEYTVVDRRDGFEIRRYEPYLVAETEVRDGFEASGNIAFRRLAGYIFGRNRESVKMNMTVPVTHDPVDDSTHRYRFVMEQRYTEASLPKPMDDSVNIVEVPGGFVAAVRYRGNRDEARFRRAERRLLSRLDEAGLEVIGRSLRAVYDGPFVPPPLRRNEVLVPVAFHGAGDSTATDATRSE